LPVVIFKKADNNRREKAKNNKTNIMLCCQSRDGKGARAGQKILPEERGWRFFEPGEAYPCACSHPALSLLYVLFYLNLTHKGLISIYFFRVGQKPVAR